MQPDRATLERMILESLAEEGVSPPDGSRLDDLALLGERALLKSVGLVSVLVGVEQRLAEECGLDLSLMSDRAMSLTRSPFRTAGTLRDYIGELIEAGDRANG